MDSAVCQVGSAINDDYVQTGYNTVKLDHSSFIQEF
jgi:hypothetical protein